MINDWLILFVLFITAISAVYILFTSNILFAAFSLIITLIGISIIYLHLNAEFVAVTQIMIYVGGIIVLIIFGIMLTQEARGTKPVKLKASHNKFWAFIISGSFFTLLVLSILQINVKVVSGSIDSGVQQIGKLLLTEYLLPFELAAILLLVVLIGAAIIASNKKELN